MDMESPLELAALDVRRRGAPDMLYTVGELLLPSLNGMWCGRDGLNRS